ncbi:MBL fold metallo-hydrolase [Pigmentiphaga aceris]|uniref:MBL fold metallo-hydrolase n=1 Tax=Pigmentiphaga aceris TaxID=1940612 RepID=A0A5C0B3G4_9BURK|nr:MBL fold metallo-hydrolase [Pigmentiphaga aceris]
MAVAASAVSATSIPFSAFAAGADATTIARTRAQSQGVYQYRIGDFQVTALSDGTVPQNLHALLTNIKQAEVDALLHHAFLANPVEVSINAYLIDTGSRLVLVEVGAGLLFGPGNGGKLLGNLKAAGYEPAQIDDILLTHIHADHSGGLTADGKVVFSNATVHVGKPDVDFFLNPANANGVDGYDKQYFQQAVASLTPYVKAGKVHAFSGETQILPGIKALPAPGHTPGHSFYALESKGDSITFIGDIVHVAAVQFPKTAITIVYDVDPKHAASERETQFAGFAAKRSLVAGAHLPYPGIGHVRAEQSGGYTFVPVDFIDRTSTAK